MIKDNYGQLVYTEQDLCDLFLENPNLEVKDILVNKTIQFDDELDLLYVPKLTRYLRQKITVDEFDRISSNYWHMPYKYKNMNIAEYILSQCKRDDELQRVGHELMLYQDRDMFDLLRYLKYLVDTMRKNNIVWGVGRGSSVSSYVLYLIGIHRIDSIYYDLPIEEFLR